MMRWLQVREGRNNPDPRTQEAQPSLEHHTQSHHQQTQVDHSETSNQEALTHAQEMWKNLFSRSSVTSDPIQRPTVITTQNLRTNYIWGDPIESKEPDITRIYAINLNGIKLDRRGGSFDSVCQVMKEVQADVLCAQEHNLDTTQLAVRSILYDTTNKHWQRNKLVMGTTPITFPNT